MKLKSLIYPLLALVALTPALLAQETAPTEAEKTSKSLSDAYVAAFNKGDVQALTAMYAEDAQYTADDGDAVKGRAEVSAAIAKFFDKNKGAQLEVKTDSTRAVTPDVIIEKGLATIGDETTKYVCTYVKKDGAWLISELDERTLPPADEAAVALDDLAWMIGSWKDNTPGVSVTTTADWTKNGHFIRRSISIVRDGEDAMDATEVIGYDPVAGSIHSWVFDSEGGFGEGAWTKDENKWLISFMATAPDGTISSAQHVITYLDENKFTWESINREKDGEALPNLDKVEVVRTTAK